MALNGVRQGIDAGQGRDTRRLRERERDVENRHSERRPWVAAGHFDMGFGIADERKGLRLAPGAGRRRHTDRREHRAGRLATAMIVVHPAAAGVDEVDPLRAVHRAAATDRHDDIGANPAGRLDAGGDMGGGRILADGGERRNGESCRLKRRDPQPRMPRPLHPRIADDQRPVAAELTSQAAEPSDRSGPDDQPRAGTELERLWGRDHGAVRLRGIRQRRHPPASGGPASGRGSR